ncbi:MAG: hypothetical protein MJ209_00200 [archaeon]|nr:hypothetical protein [archaeon]
MVKTIILIICLVVIITTAFVDICKNFSVTVLLFYTRITNKPTYELLKEALKGNYVICWNLYNSNVMFGPVPPKDKDIYIAVFHTALGEYKYMIGDKDAPKSHPASEWLVRELFFEKFMKEQFPEILRITERWYDDCAKESEDESAK